MLDKQQDHIKKLIEVALIHFYRMDEAWKVIGPLLPLNENVYTHLSSEQAAFIDQYIFRFAKVQDLIGEKLFRAMLKASLEDIERFTFKDVLNRIEKFGVIDSAELWLEIRETRNDISHEYPAISEEAIASLNTIFKLKPTLEQVFQNCLEYLKSQGVNY
jgi:hypothetical protein